MWLGLFSSCIRLWCLVLVRIGLVVLMIGLLICLLALVGWWFRVCLCRLGVVMGYFGIACVGFCFMIAYVIFLGW